MMQRTQPADQAGVARAGGAARARGMVRRATGTAEGTGGRHGPRVSRAVLAHLADARARLADATAAPTPAARYVSAHLAALRAAAGILAARPRPAGGRRRLRSAWELLPEVEPQLADWAAYFAVSATKRAAAEAGMVRAVSQTDAEELIVEADRFVGEIESILGVPGQPRLPMAG